LTTGNGQSAGKNVRVALGERGRLTLDEDLDKEVRT
jgi:hypothetical protein